MPNVDAALAALTEARLLAETEGSLEEISSAADVAIKALKDDTISDADLEGLHPSVERKVRTILGR